MRKSVKVGAAAIVVVGIIAVLAWPEDPKDFVQVTPWMRVKAPAAQFIVDIPHVVRPTYTEWLQMKIDGSWKDVLVVTRHHLPQLKPIAMNNGHSVVLFETETLVFNEGVEKPTIFPGNCAYALAPDGRNLFCIARETESEEDPSWNLEPARMRIDAFDVHARKLRTTYSKLPAALIKPFQTTSVSLFDFGITGDPIALAVRLVSGNEECVVAELRDPSARELLHLRRAEVPGELMTEACAKKWRAMREQPMADPALPLPDVRGRWLMDGIRYLDEWLPTPAGCDRTADYRDDGTFTLRFGEQEKTGRYAVARQSTGYVVSYSDIRDNGKPNCLGKPPQEWFDIVSVEREGREMRMYARYRVEYVHHVKAPGS